MFFNILLNAISTETIIGIVAVCAIVISVVAIVFTAVKNFVKTKKSADTVKESNSEQVFETEENIADEIVQPSVMEEEVSQPADDDITAEVLPIVIESEVKEDSCDANVTEEEIAPLAEKEEKVIEEEVQPVVEAEENIIEEVVVNDVVEESKVDNLADEVVATVDAGEKEDIDLTGFEKQLIEAGADTVELYSFLKNYFLSFNLARSSASRNFDTYKVNKDIIARMIFVNNKLTVCLPIDPNDAKYSEKKYAHTDLSSNGTYAKVPFAMEIRCGLNARRCIELFEKAVINNLKLVKNSSYEPIDYETKYLNVINGSQTN